MNVKSLHVSFFVCRFEQGRRPLRCPPSPSDSLTGENQKRPWKKAEMSQTLRGNPGPIRDKPERKPAPKRQESEKNGKSAGGDKPRRPAPLIAPLHPSRKTAPEGARKARRGPENRLISRVFSGPPLILSLLRIPNLHIRRFPPGYAAKSESYEGEEHIV